jgi:hypothetical protein
MLDIAVAYRRYQFIGDEFLTWLWYTIENDTPLLGRIDRALEALEIGSRMVLENRYRKDAGETVTIKGEEANMDEGLLALKKGAMVAEVNLVYRSGDHEWRFTLKGESLNLSNLKVPETGKIETKQDVEGAVIERDAQCAKIIDLINSLFRHFIQLRVSNEWSANIVPAIRKWIVA